MSEDLRMSKQNSKNYYLFIYILTFMVITCVNDCV